MIASDSISEFSDYIRNESSANPVTSSVYIKSIIFRLELWKDY
jgi:hypothetical protein